MKKPKASKTMTDEGAFAIAEAIRELARSITPTSAAPAPDATGGFVSSLTEAVMGVTAALSNISNSMEGIASSLDDIRGELRQRNPSTRDLE